MKKKSYVFFINKVKPGMRFREIGNVIQNHVNQYNFSVVRSYCGHGIHRLFHTAPNIPHYSSNFFYFDVH
jgi:methionyl aminopeptidase